MNRRGGRWRAEITDAGRHYLEHGTDLQARPRPGWTPSRCVRQRVAHYDAWLDGLSH